MLEVWFGALRHGYRFARMLQADDLEERGYRLAAQALRSEPVVAYSRARALAVTADGRVVTWGRIPYRRWNRPYVRKPDWLLRDVRAVAAGADYYLALTRDGRVVAWGRNDRGQCEVPPDLPPVEAVAAGFRHSLAVTAEGRVVAWRHNVYGQCDVPADLPSVVAVAATYKCSLALTADGDVVSWGSDRNLDVPPGLKAVAVATSDDHALAVTPEGQVVAWGSNAYGQCDVPTDLPPVVSAAAGKTYSATLTVTGDVVVWGRLGLPRGALSGFKAVAVVAYESPLLFVTPEGQVLVWSDYTSDPRCDVPPGLTVRVAPSGVPAGNT